jgi:dihydroorotate dehydrogenase (NAD+) catalytic subunit
VGGISGVRLPLALRYNQELRQKVHLLLIMGCGVTCADDVQRYFDLGADAVSLCTLALRRPQTAAGVVLKFNAISPPSLRPL